MKTPVHQSKTCVCGFRKCVVANHPDPKCKFRRSILCRIGIECEHGYDCCPTCDPCTCLSRPAEGSGGGRP